MVKTPADSAFPYSGIHTKPMSGTLAEFWYDWSPEMVQLLCIGITRNLAAAAQPVFRPDGRWRMDNPQKQIAAIPEKAYWEPSGS